MKKIKTFIYQEYILGYGLDSILVISSEDKIVKTIMDIRGCYNPLNIQNLVFENEKD